MTHLDNLMSVASIKGTVAEHSAHFDNLVSILQADPEPDANLKSRHKLAQVRMILARANRNFQRGRYQRALRGYRRLQGLIYGLLQPSFNPDVFLNPSLAIPLDTQLFPLLMTTSLDLVEKIAPNGIYASAGNATLQLPSGVVKGMQPFVNLGVSAETGLAPEVREAAMVGADYMANKQWTKAAEFYQLGLRGINGNDATQTSAKAALEMNLGTALLQAGQLDQAQRQLKQAVANYKEAGDTVGQSKALTNQAAAQAKAGDFEGAEKTLEQADKLLVEAGGKIPVKQPTFEIRPPISPDTPAIPVTPGFPTGPVVVSPLTPNPNFPGVFPGPRGRLTLSSTLLASATPMVSMPLATNAATVDSSALSGAIDASATAVVINMPAASDGWVIQDLTTVVENEATLKTKSLAAQFGKTELNLTWQVDEKIDGDAVIETLYKSRLKSTDLALLNFRYDLDSDFSLRLPHLYYFSLPVKIGDCYRELGQYDQAIDSFRDAANYEFLNEVVEMPSVWLRLAEVALLSGDLLFRQGKPVEAVEVYTQVMTLEEKAAEGAFLYDGPLEVFGDKVAQVIDDLDNAANSNLNPRLSGILVDIRTKLRMIKAGLNFWGIPANYFPIFKFDYLQSVATHFAQLAVQAEREFINFTARGEDEELTRTQIEQSVESAKAEVDLAEEQLDYAQAEADVTQEALDLARLRRQNAEQQRQDFADAAYEMAHLDAASQFAGGPEGYSVSYSYYSPSEGGNVTLEGSDAYKVMADAAYKKGMISRDLELANMDRQIAELEQNEDLAEAQAEAAEARVDVAQQQLNIANLHQDHAEELLDQFEDQTFTPEVWFQLGAHMRWISISHMYRALQVAHKMELAYELETGAKVNAIKDSYTTSIVSGLLSADYLLKDIEYFTFHRIMQSKAKDVPIKQEFSLASLNPSGFATVFKKNGILDFDLALADFDRAYPGSYMRKIKKVEMVVEGLLPPGGVHGTLKNTGISRDRRKDGEIFFRLQPRETLWLSEYSPKGDIAIYQPDNRVLDVFEHCGVASGWTLDIPPHANDLDYATISDVRMIVYYTAQHDPLLETSVRSTLPKSGSEAAVIPLRILLPDAYFAFLDTGEMTFDLRAADFAYNQEKLAIKEAAIRIVRQDGADPSGISLRVETGGDQGQDITDANGTVRSDPNAPAPLNALRGNPVIANWRVTAPEADNPGFDRASIRDVFLFLEYDFDYRGL